MEKKSHLSPAQIAYHTEAMAKAKKYNEYSARKHAEWTAKYNKVAK